MSVLNKQDVILPYGVTQEPVYYVNGGYQRVAVTDSVITSFTIPHFAVAAAITYEDDLAGTGIVARFGFNHAVNNTSGNPVTHLMYFELYGLTSLTNFCLIATTGNSGYVNIQFYR